MPPKVFSTLTSPNFLSAWLLTCLRSSRFSGMTCLRVVLRSGSDEEEYGRAVTEQSQYISSRQALNWSYLILLGGMLEAVGEMN